MDIFPSSQPEQETRSKLTEKAEKFIAEMSEPVESFVPEAPSAGEVRVLKTELRANLKER